MAQHILGGFPKINFDPEHPEAFAICDLCGFARLHKDLRKQMAYRGNALQWNGFLVCFDTCLDVPYEFDRPIVLPPDPQPVFNARPPNWKAQEQGNGDSGSVQQLIEPD